MMTFTKTRHPVLAFVLLSLSLASAAKPSNFPLNTIGSGNSEKKHDKMSIPAGYQKEHRPGESSLKPTTVWFDIHVVTINALKAADLDFRLDMILTQRWIDERLNFSEEMAHVNRDYIILPTELIDFIWQPNPNIVNSKATDVGRLVQKLITVRIYKNFTVEYTVNVLATVACAMDYSYFPMDHQVCPMFIESFAYDETEVQYRWVKYDPFTIDANLRMLQFDVSRPLHYHETSAATYHPGRNFSQIIACFRFHRLLGGHIIQTFAPCFMIVSLSWFSFWIDPKQVSTRMSLLVTSMLTLVTQFVGLKADVPPVAYLKAVDVWMAGCFLMNLCALGEYVFILFFHVALENMKIQFTEKLHKEEVFKKLELERSSMSLASLLSPDGKPVVASSSKSDTVPLSPAASVNSMEFKKSIGKFSIRLQYHDPKKGEMIYMWDKIDGVCRWAFPTYFTLFCTCYWIALYIHEWETAIQEFSPQVNLNRSTCLA